MSNDTCLSGFGVNKRSDSRSEAEFKCAAQGMTLCSDISTFLDCTGCAYLGDYAWSGVECVIPPSAPPPSLPPPTAPPFSPAPPFPPPYAPQQTCDEIIDNRVKLPVGDMAYCGRVSVNCESYYFGVFSYGNLFVVPCITTNTSDTRTCVGSVVLKCRENFPPPSPPSLPLPPLSPPLPLLPPLPSLPPSPFEEACDVSVINKNSLGNTQIIPCNGDGGFVGYLVDSSSVFSRSIYLPRDLPEKMYRADVVLYNDLLSLSTRFEIVEYLISFDLKNSINDGVNITVEGIGPKGSTLVEVSLNLSPEDFSIGTYRSNDTLISENAVVTDTPPDTSVIVNVTDYMKEMVEEGFNNNYISFRFTASTLKLSCLTREGDCVSEGYLLENFRRIVLTKLLDQVVCDVLCAGQPRNKSVDTLYTNLCCQLPLLDGAAFVGIVGDQEQARFLVADQIWEEAVESDNVLIIYAFRVPKYEKNSDYSLTFTVSERFEFGIPLRIDTIPQVTALTIDEFALIVENNDVFYDPSANGTYTVVENAVDLLVEPRTTFTFDITEFVKYSNSLGNAGLIVGLRIVSFVDICTIAPCARTTGYAIEELVIQVREKDDGLSAGGIVGIVIGSCVLLLLLIRVFGLF